MKRLYPSFCQLPIRGLGLRVDRFKARLIACAFLLGMNLARYRSIQSTTEGLMLVLARRAELGDQSKIRIGDDIELTVVEVRGDQVRIGVDAPKNVSVHRKEVYLQLYPEEPGAEGTP